MYILLSLANTLLCILVTLTFGRCCDITKTAKVIETGWYISVEMIIILWTFSRLLKFWHNQASGWSNK